MKLTRRDLIALAIIVIIAIVAITSMGREKAKPIPIDDKHRSFFEAMEKGGDRSEVERRCVACHNPQSIPLPKKHPPKEQCLICHKLRAGRR